MKISIDPHSGFCFGVVKAIATAEQALRTYHHIYCLGDIVHNNEEVCRLKNMGMDVVDLQQLQTLQQQQILIRAHGEPPSTYKLAAQNNNTIIDATCTVVLHLQKQVKNGYQQMQEKNGQVVIFGKKGHAEVIGLVGQTNNTAIVISSLEEIEYLNYNIPMRLYAQTTQNLHTYKIIAEAIENKYRQHNDNYDFIWYDTICRQVSNREESLKKFAQAHDVIIFVSGAKSSNGMVLFNICQSVNANSHLVSSIDKIDKTWFAHAQSVGICGATSTPLWLMQTMAEHIQLIVNQQ
ncbi:MAG: 4-hydroxy-3-methylbut-2-enyl diphosphate reductase [Bacteroidales bacterium]|nr:4-hydroxy-3-methylbut-2-enyl diphosphate reductase [Bacteroidales bacterium]